jgi:hypothetical protein
MAAIESLKNYHVFSDMIKTLQDNCELIGDIFTPGAAYGQNFSVKIDIEGIFRDAFDKEEIFVIAKNAMIEIEDLVSTNNNNSQRLINNVSNECQKFDLRFREITSKNKIISDSENLTLEGKEKYFFTLPQNEKNIYLAYTKVVKVFDNFYYDFKDKTGLPEPATGTSNSSLVKIKWRGDQKQLAELFISLENLNWIESIQDGERQSICRNICNLFDISHTKKKPNSDEVKSFAEIMKPDTDKKTKVKTYSKIFTTRYKKKFSRIETNE